MILVLPEKKSFTWFSDLIWDKASILSAYLASLALRETKSTIRLQNRSIFVEQPEVMVIDSEDPRYEVVHEFEPKDNPSSTLRKYDDMFEYEYGYRPDLLGFYLANDIRVRGLTLDKGIYIMVPRIMRYINLMRRLGLDIDPNALIGTVFYHEYMHMLFDISGIRNCQARLRVLSKHDLEEVACEGLSYLSLPRNSEDLLGEFLFETILASSQENYTISCCGVKLEILIAKQLMNAEDFLSLPRTYPYRLIRNFFNDKKEIGWLLLDEILDFEPPPAEHDDKENINESTEHTNIKPKVVIVIKNAHQETYNVSLGYKYNYSKEGILY